MSPSEISRSLEEKYGLDSSPGLIKYAELKKQLSLLNSQISQALEEKGIAQELAETLFAAMRVEQNGLASPSEISRSMDLPATTISSRLRRMEDLGWIDREHDDNDRRALAVKLLPKGIEAARIAWAGYASALNHLVEQS